MKVLSVILFIGGWTQVSASLPSAEAADAQRSASCDLTYRLPGDIAIALPVEQTLRAQYEFDTLSWKTFIALNSPGVESAPNRLGDNPTQWQQWASTVDLISCQNNPALCGCLNGRCTPVDRYYPAECQSIDGYWQYRVLGQISKIDDSFLEADRGELSNHPVIDENGKFIRYEILVNPVTYEYVTSNGLYNRTGLSALQTPVNFPCGSVEALSGDPNDPGLGSFVIKNAWMELDPERPLDQFKAGYFHTEDMMVYTPADRNLSGIASCEVKTMALVGMHIAHKTNKQPTWIWSTFEHRWNAPDCTRLPPEGDQAGSGPSTACPANVPHSYNFYPQHCSEDGELTMRCQSCNLVPVSNSPDPQRLCTSADVSGHPDNTGWCLDLPPAAERGVAKLCRQVPVAEHYPTADALNQACAAALGNRSVWSNYQLISTQWLNQGFASCQSSGPLGGLRPDLYPQIDLAPAGAEPQPRPYLANTSMESYGRSNCTGCHKAAAVVPSSDSISTDMMYWLQLEAFSVDSAGAD